MTDNNNIIAQATAVAAELDEKITELQNNLDLHKAARASLRGTTSFNTGGALNLIKGNWGKISGFGAALGLPILAADSGAFKGVINVVSKLFGI